MKAALTRTYNKEGRPVPFATSVNVKKVKTTETEYGLEGGEEDVEDEEVEDDLTSDAMIRVRLRTNGNRKQPKRTLSRTVSFFFQKGKEKKEGGKGRVNKNEKPPKESKKERKKK